jgi:hypothetical protein
MITRVGFLQNLVNKLRFHQTQTIQYATELDCISAKDALTKGTPRLKFAQSKVVLEKEILEDADVLTFKVFVKTQTDYDLGYIQGTINQNTQGCSLKLETQVSYYYLFVLCGAFFFLLLSLNSFSYGPNVLAIGLFFASILMFGFSIFVVIQSRQLLDQLIDYFFEVS